MKMFGLLVTLLFLHETYSLVPVMRVKLGEPAFFRCALPEFKLTQQSIYWYKQSPGDTLRLIVKLTLKQQKFTETKFGTLFSESRWNVTSDKKMAILKTLRTTQEDLGTYHCVIKGLTGDTEWSATNLILTGNTLRNPVFTVIQQPAVYGSVQSGDTATLQCSVFFDSENMTCSEDLSMSWFQVKSNNTYPNVIHIEEKRHDVCEKRSDTVKSCVFQFSKVVNSSDTGIIYCAVASCGRILFGNGTRLEIANTTSFEFIALVTVVTGLVFSFILNIVLICYQAPRACQRQSHEMESTPSEEPHPSLRQRIPDPADNGNQNYAALDFSISKKIHGGKKKKMKTQECVYSQVKI